MFGKYTVVIFICACAAAVSSSAYHPRPISSGHNNPKEIFQRGENEIDNEGVEPDNSAEKGEDNKIGNVPKTILSVQYDSGLIKELYLAQGVGALRKVSPWRPSVSEKTRICGDLCEAGLGGDPCGFSCQDQGPLFFKNLPSWVRGVRTPTTVRPTTKTTGKSTATTPKKEEENLAEGHPRTDVCPILCKHGLGKPLCECTSSLLTKHMPWSSICGAFCSSSVGSYHLEGCPNCDDDSSRYKVEIEGQFKSDSDIWVQYCREQCSTGNGGAACNCDKIPFYLKN